MNNTSISWYPDITPNQMFSLYVYPISGKCGLPLCEKHGRHLEQKEVVILDKEATEASHPDHCWVYNIKMTLSVETLSNKERTSLKHLLILGIKYKISM